jgi:hypothetical protein
MSAPAPRPSSFARFLLPVAVAALSALLAARMIGHDPRFLAPLLAFAVLLFTPAVIGRRRMRRLLMSGDV